MANEKILIVDDDKNICDLLRLYLEKEGYKIVDAPRAVYVDGIWNQEDADKWLTIIQVPVEKA